MELYNSFGNHSFFALFDETGSVLEIEVVWSTKPLEPVDLELEAIFAFGFDSLEDLDGYVVKQITYEKFYNYHMRLSVLDNYLASKNRLESLRLEQRKKLQLQMLLQCEP